MTQKTTLPRITPDVMEAVRIQYPIEAAILDKMIARGEAVLVDRA